MAMNDLTIFPDRLTAMTEADLAALPVEQLYEVHLNLAQLVDWVKKAQAKTHGALQRRYVEREREARAEVGKDFGVVHLQDESIRVTVDTPKRISWDQKQLAEMAKRIAASGDRVEDYLDVEFSVPESRFTNWPAALRRDLVVTVDHGPGDGSPWSRWLAEGAQRPPLKPADSPHLGTVANVQYTSGTTGFPKGCPLTQGYWLNVAQAASLLHPAPMTRFFTAQPFFYMDPFWQLLMALRSGGTLVAAQRISASQFLGWLADHEIEWAQLPELALKSLDSVQGRRFALRQVFTFGWSAAARQTFLQRFPQTLATEGFGMTEIGLGSAMPPGPVTAERASSVGVAGLRRSLRIVDEAGQPVPPGTTGELQVHGAHLFLGYFNQPQATAQAFDPDGWFRTGDAFVSDADGYLRIVGRFKDMIRRSSENISAREVEAVLRLLPEVLDCAALPVPDPVRGEEVMVLLQLQPGARAAAPARAVLPPERVIEHCRAQLAPFKVPRYLKYVDDFPRTASNKIAKHLLRPADGDLRTGAYDRVTQAWC
jgi:acyl-CoA synthetase (AMP-forming)/AMP-acid ligase II